MSKQKTAQLINGKQLADAILIELNAKVALLPTPPGLAVVLVGDDPASERYVSNKKKACHAVGIDFHEYRCGGKFLPNITQSEIVEMVSWLNNDPTIDGIIVQLPLPERFDTTTIISALDPKKDVDGFHPKNWADLLTGKATITPPLIAAVMLALLYTDEKLTGKTAVVVAKNPIFYEPLLAALQRQGLSVSQVSPVDPALDAKIKTADVLITIAGSAQLITKAIVKPHAIVIDAGTTMIEDNQFVGDVDPAVVEVADWLTPVPGGIGPLTVAMLLKNTYDLHAKQ